MKPIIFSSDMVKAILDGRKTQTRRVIKPLPITNKSETGWMWVTKENILIEWGMNGEINSGMYIKCPYGKIGDKLYVKENFEITDYGNIGDGGDDECYGMTIKYSVDDKMNEKDIELTLEESRKFNKWKNKIGRKSKLFMFKSLSRIKLEINGIRVERVKDITRQDCFLEGIPTTDINNPNFSNAEPYNTENTISMFRGLWDSINKKTGYGWEVNPWVWVLEFKVIKSMEG